MDEIFKDVTDDEIFGDDSSSKVDSREENKMPENTENIAEEAVNVIQDGYSPKKNIQEGVVPELRGDNFPSEYIKMADRIKASYQLLPSFNFTEIYSELGELSIKCHPTPTLQVIDDELQKIQAAKDRLSEIFIDVYKSYTFKKRAVDILVESWDTFSSEKSADKRKGDATFRLSNFIMDLATIESLMKACMHILKNLDSSHDRLSRTITVWQLTTKIGDIGRGPLPSVEQDLFNRKSDLDPTESKEAEMENF